MTVQRGAVLPLVLMTLLIVGAAAFAMSFKVTLDSLAARSAVSAASARAQAAGALALGVAALHEALAADQEPPGSFGPWPEHGIGGTVRVEAVGTVAREPGGSALVYSLVASATVRSATAETEVALYAAPELRLVYRRRRRGRMHTSSRPTPHASREPRALDMPAHG